MRALLAVLLLAAVFDCAVPEQTSHEQAIHLNEWAVEIHGGPEQAKKVAGELGLDYVGPVGSLFDFYLFKHNGQARRSRRHASDVTTHVQSHDQVLWAEQQRHRRRVRRSLSVVKDLPQPGPSIPLPPTDPMWDKMWYHQRRYQDPTAVWQRGYTGQGIVVSILDDGYDYTHPDLKRAYDAKASFDYNSNDPDPMPRPSWNDINKHGTRCAGEVAATNNDRCSLGVAFNSSVGGVRMLDGDVTDSIEGHSLSLNPQHIDIYSSSWGPDDDGKAVDGPGRLAKTAFKQGAYQGRGGLGSIFVWASGNGGRYGDSCSCDGYTNSLFTISISSSTEFGNVPWYSEACASTMATTYSSGTPRERKIVTPDLHHSCTTSHSGTSASAPMAAGILALVLEANPALTWRDMQHLVVLTSQPGPLNQDGWVTNAVGRRVSHSFGYGLMHTAALVNLARHWTTSPTMRTCVEETQKFDGSSNGVYTLPATACRGTDKEVRYAENVIITVTAISKDRRGAMEMEVVSPLGTPSTILPLRRNDNSKHGFKHWNFRIARVWGEDPVGDWTLTAKTNGQRADIVKQVTVTIHGTFEPPAFTELPESCHAECHDGCVGPTASHCHSCKHFTVLHRNGAFECVSDGCPEGFYRDGQKRCSPCHPECKTCQGAESNQCSSCESGSNLVMNRCETGQSANKFSV